MGSNEKAPHLPLYAPIPWIENTDSVEKHPFIRYAICDCMDSIVQKRQVGKGKSCRIATTHGFLDTIDEIDITRIKVLQEGSWLPVRCYIEARNRKEMLDKSPTDDYYTLKCKSDTD